MCFEALLKGLERRNTVQFDSDGNLMVALYMDEKTILESCSPYMRSNLAELSFEFDTGVLSNKGFFFKELFALLLSLLGHMSDKNRNNVIFLSSNDNLEIIDPKDGRTYIAHSIDQVKISEMNSVFYISGVFEIMEWSK